jgi:hypothetical protein
LKPAGANSSVRPYLKKPFTKIGLVEWLKVKALSSSSSTAKKEKKKRAGWPGTHYAAQVGFELMFLLPQPSSVEYMHTPPCPACYLFILYLTSQHTWEVNTVI